MSSFPNSTPSPAPSAAGDTNSPSSKKRKREDIVYSQPELTGYGTELLTHVTFVIDYLKRRSGEAKTATDIFDRLSLHRESEEHKEALVRAMRINPRIRFEPDLNLAEQTWQSGVYRHNPIIPNVRDAEALLALLQKRPDASGVSVKDLKDGWPDCDEVLAQLEAEHRIRMIRSKKDARVWADDPSLCHDDIDPEFRMQWLRVAIPGPDEIVRKLKAAGLKPASEDPDLRVSTGQVKPKQQKKRAVRKTNNATNTHMAHLLKQWEEDSKR